MKLKLFIIYALFGIYLGMSSALAQTVEKPCPEIEIQSAHRINLNSNEKTLICGDPKLKSYQDLPDYQIEYFLRGFLQARGHLTPIFESVGGKLVVKAGDRSHLKKIETIPASKELEDQIKRFFINEVITPQTLDKVENYVVRYHSKQSIPCSKARTEFFPEDARLVIISENLDMQEFQYISVDDIPGLHPNSVKRFQAFKKTHRFNPDKLELTKKRMLRAGVVQNTYFQTVCSDNDENHRIYQKHNVGPAKSLRFGVGINTEVGPLSRVRWSNQRFKNMASTLEATLQASLIKQSLKFSSDYFPHTLKPRRSFVSELEFSREQESDYEEKETSLSSKIKWQEDTQEWSWKWMIGPVYNFGSYRTDAGQTNRSFNSLAFQSIISVQDHTYEIFDLYPKEGNQFSLGIDLRPKSLGLSYDLAKFDFSYLNIKEVMEWGKGYLSTGVRLNLGSTWIDKTTDLDLVPTALRYYGGGSDDNRGLRLKSLPKNNGQGALTKALIRFELRKTHFFTPDFEALVFTDVSKFSETSWQLEERTWYSPGLGLRWLSPIGPLQLYAAKAYATKPKRQNELYFFIGLGGQL